MKCMTCGAKITKRQRHFTVYEDTKPGALRRFKKRKQCGPCGDKDLVGGK